MPVIELISPERSPGRAVLGALSREVTDALEIPRGHCWVRWTALDAEDVHRPEWEHAIADVSPAPMVFVHCKSSYGDREIEALVQSIAGFLARRLGCPVEDVYVAVTPIEPGHLRVRGAIWHGGARHA